MFPNVYDVGCQSLKPTHTHITCDIL